MSFKNRDILNLRDNLTDLDGKSENVGPARVVSVQAVTTDLTVGAFVFVDADVAIDTDNWVTEVAHGLVTGQKVALTGAGLPTGLTARDYFIIKLDDDKFQFSDTYITSLAGTAEVISAAAGAVDHTVTPTILAGTLYLEESNDGSNWVAISGKTSSIATDINIIWEMVNFTTQHIRARLTQADGVGRVDIDCNMVAKV